MAAPLPVPGVARLRMVHSLASEQVGWAVYFSNGGDSWNNGDITTLAEQGVAAWVVHLKSLFTTDLTLAYGEATDLSSDMGPQVIALGSGAAGSVDPPTVSNNVAMHLNFLQSRRYRGGRFGVNLGGLPESARTDTRTWSSETTDSWDVAFAEWLTAVQTDVDYSIFPGTPFQVGVSYMTGHEVREIPLVLPILGYDVQKRLCTRKKRLGKGIYPES